MANSKNTFLAVGKQLLRTALPVQANKFCTTALRKSSEVPHITSADRKLLKIISKSFLGIKVNSTKKHASRAFALRADGVSLRVDF